MFDYESVFFPFVDLWVLIHQDCLLFFLLLLVLISHLPT